MMGWQCHQLDHVQIICTSLHTNNHTSTALLNLFAGRLLFLTPNQQCQSTVLHSGSYYAGLLNLHASSYIFILYSLSCL